MHEQAEWRSFSDSNHGQMVVAEAICSNESGPRPMWGDKSEALVRTSKKHSQTYQTCHAAQAGIKCRSGGEGMGGNP